MIKPTLDSFDRNILHHIQRQGDLGPAELSSLIHLSPSQCSRRLQRLRDGGYIERTTVLLNKNKLNLSISAYIAVKLRSHDNDVVQAFQDRIEALPEVLSCEYLTGETDFMLRVHTKDLDTYSSFISNKLMTGSDIETVRSSIILKSLKQTTAMTLEFC